MLARLEVMDFAIIDQVALDLSPGLNVFTGETGAGKSILLDALGAALGVRVGSEVIRSGTEGARVDALFAPQDGRLGDELLSLLAQIGVEVGDELLLSREIRIDKPNLCRINGRIVPLKLLSEVGSLLAEVHIQGEQWRLGERKYQLALLDRYGGCEELRSEVASKVKALREIWEELRRIQELGRERERERDLLTYHVNEIEAAKLRPGEDQELGHELVILSNREKILTLVNEAIAALQGEELDTRGARDLAATALASLRSLSAIDHSTAALGGQLEEAESLLEEVDRALISYRDNLDFDPARLEEVQERIHLIDQLKRKYAPTIEGILAYREKALASLEELDGSEERKEKLAAEEATLLQEVQGLCGELSKRRKEASQKLQSNVNEVLAEVGMKASRYSVVLAEEELSERGTDSCEFLISAGPGEPPMPLRKTGSSGEISRVMLALKSVLGDSTDDTVVVLDEIDSGVGARSADMLGRRLAALAESHQVLCVTHLPLLAAYADRHFRVNKIHQNGRTTVEVIRLGERGRLQELRLMVGTKDGAGEKVVEEMLEHAHMTKAKKSIVAQMNLV